MSNVWVCYFPIFLILIMMSRRRRALEGVIKARIGHRKGDKEMQELAKRFVGKDVVLTVVSSDTVDGVLKEVVDNAVVIEKKGKETVVNLDYVVRMKEYPVDKKGKKKLI